jgi:hypothetical protein
MPKDKRLRVFHSDFDRFDTTLSGLRTLLLASGLPFSWLSKEDTWGDGHGTSDRVLYSGAISQASEVDPASRAGKSD